MKILIPLLTVVQLSSAHASLVAVMDTGSDISHKDLSAKSWVNKNEKLGSKVDLDNDGLAGDVNGWDYTENSPTVFDGKYNALITSDVKTFYNYYSLYELGKLNQASPELAWLKTHTNDEDLMNKVNFVGGYIHGTHVAGISALNNANVKILSMKILPTVYKELKKVSPDAPKLDPKDTPVEQGKTVEEFTAEVLENSNQQINEMIGYHTFLNFHHVDVVNQSFGIGFNDAVNFIKSGFTEAVKREPTKVELEVIVKLYFASLYKNGPKMFSAAPNTVFAIAAGNDSSNNDLNPDFPADIPAENKIVVAATNGYKALADFSNYGATRVDVAAPGVAITSTAPTNAYIALSGTSQATPLVTNIIAAMKDLNPALSARDLKAIVLGTVDLKTWLRGKVKTGGIVNKLRALKAAELAKSQNVDLAISNARSAILDMPVDKSFVQVPEGLALQLKPFRPSLLPLR